MTLRSLRRRAAPDLALNPIALAAVLALSAAPPAANAVTYTWTGAAGNSWSNAGSWQGNAAPPTGGLTTSDLVFGLSNALFPSLNTAWSIRSLTFNSGASGFTFDGGPLTIGAGGITHNAASNQGFSTAQVVLGADQTWLLASNAGTLSFGSGLNTTGGGVARALTIKAATTTGSGNVINGVISGGGSLTKTGGGILTLTGANTYMGGTTFAAGAINVGSTGALGSTGTLTFNGGTLQYSSANQADYSARFSTAANQQYRFDTNGQKVTLASGLASTGGSLFKTGAGTLTLTGAGTSIDNATVNAGTLAISGSVQTNASTTSLTVASTTGSTAIVNLQGSTSILSTGEAVVGSAGSGTFNQSGGSFTTNGSGLYIGFHAGAGGTYNLSNGSLTTGRTQVSDDANTGVFTQSGGTHTTSVLSLTGYSTSSQGRYDLNGGTLVAGMVISGDFGNIGTSTFNFNGGTVQASAASTSFLQGLTTANVQAGGARIDTPGFAVTVAQNLQHDTTAGAPFSDGGLTKLGSGTLTLAGTNTYTGGTTFAAGVINVGSTGALGSTGTLTFNGGTLQYSSANQADYSARFSTAANQQYRFDTNGQNVTLASGLASTGGSLFKTGAGTLTLTGAGTSIDNATVNAGTLAISGSVQTNASTTSLTVASTTGSTATVNLQGNTSSLSTGEVVVGSLGSGTFSQSGGSFTTNGKTLSIGKSYGASGTYNLSGSTSRLYTGITYVGVDGYGVFNQSGGSFTTNGKTLVIGKGYGDGTYNLSNGSLTTGRTQVGDNTNTSVFTQSGGTHTTPVLSLTGYSTSSKGRYDLNGGTLVAGMVISGDFGDIGTSTFNFNGGTLQASAANASFVQGLTAANIQTGGARVDTAGFNVTIAQALVHDTTAGAAALDGGLTKLGAGTLTLTGANTFNGALTIAAGTLAVATESNLGSGGGGGLVTVNGGGTLLFTNSATLARTYNLGVATLVIGSGSGSGSGSGNTLTLGSGASINGGFLNGPGTTVLGSGSSLNGVTAFAGSTLTQTSGAASVNGATIRGTLTQTGGALTVNNVFVSGSGRLNVGGTLNTTGTELQGVTTISTGGSVANSGSSLYLTGGSRTTINSGGTLSTATGTTIELNGSQLVNNGRQSGVLDINYGSLAKGSGSFGTINVADGGKFSPGNSPGTATAESFSFGAGGRYDFELNTANARFGIDSDLLIIGGTLLVNAGSTPNSVFTIGVSSLNQANQSAALGDFDSSRSYHFLLVDAGSVSGFDSSKFYVDTGSFSNSLNGGSFRVDLNGNDLYLDFNPAAVPEPATWAMWLAAAAMGASVRSRRQRRTSTV